MSLFNAMSLMGDVSPFVVPHEANSALSRTITEPSFHATGAVFVFLKTTGVQPAINPELSLMCSWTQSSLFGILFVL